jgi:hypothetical protein
MTEFMHARALALGYVDERDLAFRDNAAYVAAFEEAQRREEVKRAGFAAAHATPAPQGVWHPRKLSPAQQAEQAQRAAEAAELKRQRAEFLEELDRESGHVHLPQPVSLRELYELARTLEYLPRLRLTARAERLQRMQKIADADEDGATAWELANVDRFRALYPLGWSEPDLAQRENESPWVAVFADVPSPLSEATALSVRSALPDVLAIREAIVTCDCSDSAIVFADGPDVRAVLEACNLEIYEYPECYGEMIYLQRRSPLDKWRRSGDPSLNEPASMHVLRSGIAVLDSRLPGCGLAIGHIVTLAGGAGCGKTSLAYEFVEAALAAGFLVLWCGPDELAEDIEARRVQRYAQAPRPEIASGGELRFIENDYVDVAWLEAGKYDSRPLMILVDSAQTVDSSSSAGKSLVERIEALYADLKRCQVRNKAIAIVTSEVTTKGAAKGGTKLGHASQVLFSLSRSKNSKRIEVTIEKNRGRGASEEGFSLLLDRENQRVLDPDTQAALGPRDLPAEILEFVRDDGRALSKNQIAKGVRGSTEAKREAVADLLSRGLLVADARGRLRLAP